MATIEGLSSRSLLRNMSLVSSTSPPPFLRLRSTVGSLISQPKLLHCKNKPLHHNHWIVSASKKNAAEAATGDTSDGENIDISSKKNKKTTRRGRKKSSKEIIPVEATTKLTLEQAGENTEKVRSTEELQNMKFYMRHLDPSTIKLLESSVQLGDEGEEEEEITRPTRGPKRKATKKPDSTRYTILTHADEQEKEDSAEFENVLSQIREHGKAIVRDDDKDANDDCMWPPLVICFGPAKASFIPYARPARRIFDRKIHEAMHELYWMPDRFFRAPGSAASSVATELARLDGRVEFMGKLGIDSLGKELLYALNASGVQTRCVEFDNSAATAVSHMKLTADGRRLKSQCVQPCAEDSFLSSDVNLDILKEAKMLYFNSSALLDPNSKSTVMEVIKIMKSQGSLIFFDLNLPLLLWHSPKEAKSLLKESFAVSNFIEMTQQELDFLCGFKQHVMENEDVKFVHRSREEVKEVWHDSLEVLFVTNGTSMISYYTKERDGFVRGTEDVPIETSNCEMAASGDAVVAALMKMLVSEPDMATDPSYLHTSIKYAIRSGLIAQLLLVTNLINSDKPPNDDEDNQTETSDEDIKEEEEEESYRDRVGELVA